MVAKQHKMADTQTHGEILHVQVSGNITSIFQYLIREVIPGQKCRLNVGPILNDYGAMGIIWNAACVRWRRHDHRQACAPVALRLAKTVQTGCAVRRVVTSLNCEHIIYIFLRITWRHAFRPLIQRRIKMVWERSWHIRRKDPAGTEETSKNLKQNGPSSDQDSNPGSFGSKSNNDYTETIDKSILERQDLEIQSHDDDLRKVKIWGRDTNALPHDRTQLQRFILKMIPPFRANRITCIISITFVHIVQFLDSR